MIPRFSNPHVIQASTKLTSRAELRDCDSSEYLKIDATDEGLPVLAKRLRELVQDGLGDLAVVPDENIARRKRRKLDGRFKDAEKETPIMFRLVSSSLEPRPLYLAPNPPPPVRSVSPAYEDNEAQAKQRRKRAKYVAVDYDWVLDQSKKSHPSLPDDLRIIHVTASSRLLDEPPAFLITERPQLPRNTRPPVPVASDSCSVTSLPCPAASPDRPIIPVNLSNDPTSPRCAISRRRRGKTAAKERSQPTFWRPNPAVRGKSLGYALGYPGSWASFNSGSKRYQRDTMRKGVFMQT